ncbi:MAG TPA: enolase C-terminal domain-like protein [Terriglobales bacterium]|nr:enolase C-terminal domain-like protein [Terriglobales bacterium]
MKTSIPIKSVRVSAFTVPTDWPEADGTFSWNKTTMVLVEVTAGGKTGMGYTYNNESTATLIHKSLSKLLEGKDAFANTEIWGALLSQVRNIGRAGVAATAISAIDTALWDLKAKLLDMPLVVLLGKCRDRIPIYGSGGFTSYSIEQLQRQFGGWVAQGIRMVKMKVGTHPEQDLDRVRTAREAIGPHVQLFVDANGAYSRKQALKMAEHFAEFDVRWFEEPVSSDDLEGLHLIRNRAPVGMEVAAGEYGYDQYYFRRMLEAGAVDVLQADATRCAGITGFLRASVLAQSFQIPLSAHTAPSIHFHPAAALTDFRHIEYFHDHARIEHIFFDGAAKPVNGYLVPDLSRPGMGLELKLKDAQRFAA